MYEKLVSTQLGNIFLLPEQKQECCIYTKLTYVPFYLLLAYIKRY